MLKYCIMLYSILYVLDQEVFRFPFVNFKIYLYNLGKRVSHMEFHNSFLSLRYKSHTKITHKDRMTANNIRLTQFSFIRNSCN